ncbi:MAG: hypothetical protein AAGB12_10460 [Pseudomonadota bacterium]
MFFVFCFNVSAYYEEEQCTTFSIVDAPVKSLQDLHSLGASALDVLTPKAKAHFIKSLKFNEKGLTTFNSLLLEEELSLSEIYGILSLFGIESSIKHFDAARIESAADVNILNNMLNNLLQCDGVLQGSACVSRATCRKTSDRDSCILANC